MVDIMINRDTPQPDSPELKRLVNGLAYGAINAGGQRLDTFQTLTSGTQSLVDPPGNLPQSATQTTRCRWTFAQEEALLGDDVGIDPPWFMFHFGKFMSSCFQWLLDMLTPAAFRVNEVVMGGYIASHVLYSLTELGVADALGDGPLTIEQLSKAVGANPERLYRCMRYAVGINFFQAFPGRRGQATRFANNRLSATLREDHVQSQKYLILSQVGHAYRAFQELPDGLTGAGNIYQMHCGTSTYWDTLRKDSLQEDRFSKAMAAIDKLCLGVLGKDIPWQNFTRVIDIGAAYGSMLAEVLQIHPHMEGVLFDQPLVVHRARHMWHAPSRAHMLNRTSFVGGDFFLPETIPKAKGKGDVYLLRLVLHDWPDADAVRILSSVRQAIGSSGATLLILDGMPNENWKDATNRVVLQTDLIMMVLFGAHERSRTQLEAVLAQSGFKMDSVIPTRSCLTGVTATPT